MRVCLYRVGRNLNRAYRTCEAFGVHELLLLECSAKLSGNLYAAKGRVIVHPIDAWPSGDVLALEIRRGIPLQAVDWQRVETLLLGGETAGLPRNVPATQRAHIPLCGRVSDLTVEAALAIVLYELRRDEFPHD